MERKIEIQYKPEGAGQYSKDHPFVITGLLPGNLRLSEEEALQIANDLIIATVERGGEKIETVRPMHKAVIHVSEGTVQGVFSDEPDISVILVDEDALESEGVTSSEREKIVTDQIRGLHELNITQFEKEEDENKSSENQPE